MTKKADRQTASPDDAPHPGVDEGEVLTTTTHDGKAVEEKVVFDYDESGQQIGWHKEVVA